MTSVIEPSEATTPQPQPIGQMQAPHQSARSSPRILVVDDEPRIRIAIRACLASEGYEIEEAPNGRAAIDQAIESPPDLMLLDLAMPELDGLSVLRLMGVLFDKPLPRVVVLTAYGSISAATTADAFGAIAFLEKPVAPETLRDTVKRALNARRSRRRDPFDAHNHPSQGSHWFG